MIGVIDYGMGNIDSICRALEECGTSVVVSQFPDELSDVSGVVLPGVGAFHQGMQNLVSHGWDRYLRDYVVSQKRPMLGICLGMQLLADEGYEGGLTQGLGLIPGQVIRLEALSGERIPHVGWNEVDPICDHDLFAAIDPGKDFYFVHSFHFKCSNAAHVLSTTPYCGQFVSAVANGHVMGVQFHPEKSQKTGFQLIRNFLTMVDR